MPKPTDAYAALGRVQRLLEQRAEDLEEEARLNRQHHHDLTAWMNNLHADLCRELATEVETIQKEYA